MTVVFYVRVMSLVDATFMAALKVVLPAKVAEPFDTILPLQVSVWASVRGFACTRPRVLAAVSADVRVIVTYCSVATALPERDMPEAVITQASDPPTIRRYSSPLGIPKSK